MAQVKCSRDSQMGFCLFGIKQPVRVISLFFAEECVTKHVFRNLFGKNEILVRDYMILLLV